MASMLFNSGGDNTQEVLKSTEARVWILVISTMSLLTFAKEEIMRGIDSQTKFENAVSNDPIRNSFVIIVVHPCFCVSQMNSCMFLHWDARTECFRHANANG
jgi:hypothetical protein